MQVFQAAAGAGALALFLSSIVEYAIAPKRLYWPMWWLTVLMALTAGYYQHKQPEWGGTRWETAFLYSGICLSAGWILWRASNVRTGHGSKLLAGAFLLLGLNNLDRRLWTEGEVHLLRYAFDHFLNAGLGIGMIVMLLEIGASAIRGNQRKDAAVYDADGLEQPVGVFEGIVAEGAAADYGKRQRQSRSHLAAGRQGRYVGIRGVRFRGIHGQLLEAASENLAE